MVAGVGVCAVEDEDAACAQRGGDPVGDDDERAAAAGERAFGDLLGAGSRWQAASSGMTTDAADR